MTRPSLEGVEKAKPKILDALRDIGRGTIPTIARCAGVTQEYTRCAVYSLVDDGLVEGERYMSVTRYHLKKPSAAVTPEQVEQVKRLVVESVQARPRRVTAQEVAKLASVPLDAASLALREMTRAGQFGTLNVLNLTIYEPRGYRHDR